MEVVRKQGRPIKESAAGRVVLSTLVQPHLKRWLKDYANKHDCSAADVLENAIQFYKYEKEKNE
jgi:hypothetical protein